ncbi:MAG TPA: VOC family protein [Thermoanaerobaculia bacterium]|nr:VOC family protein [Thermoanaerobaculia bacterium]
MEIRQFRVVVRAKNFDTSCLFYGESLALPRVQTWEREDQRGALFQAGPGVIEVLGRAEGAPPSVLDTIFEDQGPDRKMVVMLAVPSAEKAYQEMHFRDKNIPGGLHRDGDGALIFETHDPDGVRILFRQTED